MLTLLAILTTLVVGGLLGSFIGFFVYLLYGFTGFVITLFITMVVTGSTIYGSFTSGKVQGQLMKKNKDV